LDLQGALRDDEVAGFIRYERGENGLISLPDFRDHFHWEIDSVRRRGGWTVAEFTNAHSAFYALTQAQLKRAIKSGGFAVQPHEREYDMLCSAATDPYTSCGLRRMIGISRLNELLILHAPNRYVGKIGLPLAMVEQQIQALLEIDAGSRPPFRLLQYPAAKDAKTYHEVLPPEIVTLALAGDSVRTVLSIGCGWGDTETKLARRGLSVAAIPLDSVIGAVPEAQGIEVLLVSLENGIRELGNRRFDAILISNILHLVNDPVALMKSLASLLSPGGRVIILSSNADYIPRRWRRDTSFHGAKRPALGALVTEATGCGLILDALFWHGYRDDTAISGALTPSRGVARFARRVWQWVRQTSRTFDEASQRMLGQRTTVAMRLSASRWFATDWAIRLLRNH
jgi:SAM-dependent methyltransferase